MAPIIPNFTFMLIGGPQPEEQSLRSAAWTRPAPPDGADRSGF